MLSITSAHPQHYNPTILQDTRELPRTDGTFGFLYRTEDGIAHGAIGDSSGIVHGRFTYTDPTGLKVNFNYNAGSRVSPGYDYNAPPIPVASQPVYSQPAPAAEPVYSSNAVSGSQPATPTYSSNPIPVYTSQPRYTRAQKQNELDSKWTG